MQRIVFSCSLYSEISHYMLIHGTEMQLFRHIFLEEIEVSAPGKFYRTEYEQQASKVIVEDRIEQSGLQDLRTILRALGGVIWINKEDRTNVSGLWDQILVLDGTPIYDLESIDYLINYIPVETIGQIDNVVVEGVTMDGETFRSYSSDAY